MNPAVSYQAPKGEHVDIQKTTNWVICEFTGEILDKTWKKMLSHDTRQKVF